jgi:hypothetical protein
MNRRACPGCAERYPFAAHRQRHVAFHCLPSGDTLRCEALPMVTELHGERVRDGHLSGGAAPAAEPAAAVPVEPKADAA